MAHFNASIRRVLPFVASLKRSLRLHSLWLRRMVLLLAPIVPTFLCLSGAFAVDLPAPQYLIFQLFVGSPEPHSGIFRRVVPKRGLLEMVRHISDSVRPLQGAPHRILGFAVGPIAMDQEIDDVRSVIRDAFEVAEETNMAVVLHLDDYMFWSQARWPDGRLLRANQGTVEWKDWSGTPAGNLNIGWLPNVKLAPQLCYENPEVKEFVNYWTNNVIGREVKIQLDRLVQVGKPHLFAGVIAGWESNLAYGYCSLSHLGYNVNKLPADFDHERERILQRHIERWAKGLHDSGISSELIYSHIGPIPRRDYETMIANLPRARIREMPQSTAFRAFWTAFNSFSISGFSAYPADERFGDIYEAVRAHGRESWAMVEGTNLVLGPNTARSPLSWEAYLARSFNHGATLVNIFGGFQGDHNDAFKRATESPEAIAAYRKFLRGDRLIEEK